MKRIATLSYDLPFFVESDPASEPKNNRKFGIYYYTNKWIITALERACTVPPEYRERDAPKHQKMIEKLEYNHIRTFTRQEIDWLSYEYARAYVRGYRGTKLFAITQEEFINKIWLSYTEPKPEIVVSWGMGVESTCILLKYLHDPAWRDFDLNRLVVVTAQTGDEFPDTAEMATKYILPLLRQYRIRFVQVARAGKSESDGIIILNDSRNPQDIYIQGGYKLSQELADNGTLPQFASGRRICTHKKYKVEKFILRCLMVFCENVWGSSDQ